MVSAPSLLRLLFCILTVPKWWQGSWTLSRRSPLSQKKEKLERKSNRRKHKGIYQRATDRSISRSKMFICLSIRPSPCHVLARSCAWRPNDAQSKRDPCSHVMGKKRGCTGGSSGAGLLLREETRTGDTAVWGRLPPGESGDMESKISRYQVCLWPRLAENTCSSPCPRSWFSHQNSAGN